MQPLSKRSLSMVLALAGSLFCQSGGHADVIVTADGSRLVGKIETMSGDKLVIVTQIAGKLEIDPKLIVSVATDDPVNVQFESGDRLVGNVSESPEPGKSIMNTAIGEVVVPTEAITALWMPGADSPEVVAIKAEEEKLRLALTPQWTLTIEAGGSRSEGNTDSKNARGRIDLRRKTAQDLLQFYLAAEYGEQNKRRNRNEYLGGVNYEYMLSERWYWYARLGLEYDEFENIDIRATASTGAGYYWLKKPEHEFKTRAGIGYRHETYSTGGSQDDAILDLGWDYRVDVKSWMQFTQSTTYSPAWDDFGDYRLVADTGLIFPLKSDYMKLKLGFKKDYNSQPPPGVDRLDSTYYANIVVELKK